MIKTECLRIHIDTGRLPPVEVVKALKRYDDKLELIWNDGWQIYRLKQHGVTKGQDLLHWQMTAPDNMLTTGLVDWLKKYDTNPLGYRDKEEMIRNWRFMHMAAVEKANKKYSNLAEDVEKIKEEIDDKFLTRRVQVATCVGMRKGKKVYAIKNTTRGLKISR